MLILVIPTFLLTAGGFYFVLIDRIKPTDNRMKKAARSFHRFYEDTNSLDAFIEEAAYWLAKYIHMDSYKRRKLEADLNSLGITMSPEMYKVSIIIKSGIIFLLGILCLLFIPILSIGFFSFSIILYFKYDSEVKEKLQKKRDEIQNELPRFACTLNQELKSSRDVLTILTNYKKNAGKSMRDELEITVADMRSGNYEAALLRFEGRVSIASLSDVVRGLIGVLRGDDNVGYFEMLSHDLDVLEVQRLENLAMRQPGKIKKYLFSLMICLLFMYLTILGVYAYSMAV
jgi:Flp pilus assembly protein TadB